MTITPVTTTPVDTAPSAPPVTPASQRPGPALRHHLVHPLSPEAVPNPFPSYEVYRRTAPSFHDPATGMWLLTGHAECRQALTSDAFSAAAGQRQRLRDDALPVSMLNTDGAQHRRLRAAAASALSAQAVRALMPELRRAALRVLQALPAGRDPALGGTGPCPRVAAESIDDHGDGASRCVTDAVTDIAEPFAAATIGIALRLEPEHWDRLRLLTDRASANLDPMISGPAAERARRASSALSEYLAGQAARLRRRDPPVDLAGLSADADLSEAERIGVVTLIAVGGYQPLVLLLAAAVDQLLARPALLDRLRTEPGPALALAIVDETLRLHSPIPFTSRVCPVTGAAGVPAGGRALALLAAANRDPAVFDRPAEFDPERPANPHLAFGTGPHYCLGAPLVRHATAEMISQLVQRRPGIRRVPGRPPMLAPSVIPRGLASLPVTWPSGVW